MRRLVWVAWVLCGCRHDPCADRFPTGTTLLGADHPGWGQEQCFQCHVYATIHGDDCLGGMSAAEISSFLDPGDPSTCLACHGDNGIGDTGATP